MSDLVIADTDVTNITDDEYMERYAADYYEWVKGAVIKMAPVGLRHDELFQYFIVLFQVYFALKPIGVVRVAPFLMRLDAIDVRREPDIQIILDDNLKNMTETSMNGPADICIEIVSPESVNRDYADKLLEYEAGGVGEYWIFDPHRINALFFRRDESGVFIRHAEDAEGNYTTPLLPNFVLHVPDLWRAVLPNPLEIVTAVRNMLEMK